MRALLVAAVLLAGTPAFGHGAKGHGPAKGSKAARSSKAAAPEPVEVPGGADLDEAASRWFTETELVDQNGRKHRFYSGLVRGQKVLINFIFSTCRTACSPITARLAEVQKLLGPRMGKEVRFLTLTVDPANDQPDALRTFAAKFGAGPGWYFLSGPPDNVHAVLRKLGGYTDNPEQHSTALLIGNPTTGTWVKVPAVASAARIAHTIEHLDDAR